MQEKRTEYDNFSKQTRCSLLFENDDWDECGILDINIDAQNVIVINYFVGSSVSLCIGWCFSKPLVFTTNTLFTTKKMTYNVWSFAQNYFPQFPWILLLRIYFLFRTHCFIISSCLDDYTILKWHYFLFFTTS